MFVELIVTVFLDYAVFYVKRLCFEIQCAMRKCAIFDKHWQPITDEHAYHDWPINVLSFSANHVITCLVHSYPVLWNPMLLLLESFHGFCNSVVGFVDVLVNNCKVKQFSIVFLKFSRCIYHLL